MIWLGQRRLKLTVYRVAVPKWTSGVNRYSGVPVGVYVVCGRRCISFVWRYAATINREGETDG